MWNFPCQGPGRKSSYLMKERKNTHRRYVNFETHRTHSLRPLGFIPYETSQTMDTLNDSVQQRRRSFDSKTQASSLYLPQNCLPIETHHSVVLPGGSKGCARGERASVLFVQFPVCKGQTESSSWPLSHCLCKAGSSSSLHPHPHTLLTNSLAPP